MADKNKIAAIIPAAGLGRRFVAGENKPLYELMGKPLVVWVLQAVQAVVEISEIVLVVKEDDLKVAADLVERYAITKAVILFLEARSGRIQFIKGLGHLIRIPL